MFVVLQKKNKLGPWILYKHKRKNTPSPQAALKALAGDRELLAAEDFAARAVARRAETGRWALVLGSEQRLGGVARVGPGGGFWGGGWEWGVGVGGWGIGGWGLGLGFGVRVRGW